MKFFNKNSLRWRLIWQLLLFQALILLCFVVVLFTYILRIEEGFVVVDPEITQVVARAISRDAQGRLVLIETAELESLRETVPDLWFIARSDKGEIFHHGSLPPIYQDFSEKLDRISFADIRDSVSPYVYSAVIRNAEGPAGKFTILGKGRVLSLTFLVFLLSNIVLLPILALLILVTVIAIPLIIRRGLSGLSSAAAQAEFIDIDRRGVRLFDQGVPSEVRPLVEAVNRALIRLDEGYDRHQRFILDAAHELRTPVAILQTRLEALPRGPLKTRLLSDAGRISSLSEQLLDIQRIDRSSSFREVDVKDLCESVVADLAPIAIDNGYQLELRAEKAAGLLTADEGALRRVLTNLVQNAIEHGGGRGTIRVKAQIPGLIEVSDEGPGIPEPERDLIFEPFHRLRPSARGAGLGLHLVREIVHQHHGNISVADSPKGAHFRIRLPHKNGKENLENQDPLLST